MTTDENIRSPDPPSNWFLVNIFYKSYRKRWFQEWKDAFAYTKKPWNYTKKDIAVDTVSSLRSYAIAGLSGLAMWIKSTFPWLIPAIKSFAAKVGTALTAIWHVATGH